MIEYLSYTVFEPKTQPSPFYGILWRLCSALFLNDTAFLPTEVAQWSALLLAHHAWACTRNCISDTFGKKKKHGTDTV